MVSPLITRVGHSCSTAGSGTLTLGGALGNVAINTASFQSASAAGATDAKIYRYLILDSNGNWEVGLGTYTASGTTLSRTVLFSNNSNTAINLSGSSQVFMTAAGEDLLSYAPSETISSGSTTDLGSVNSLHVIVSGTTTISSLGTVANLTRFVRFSGALVLTYNASSLILPGASNITTAAGDTAIFASDSSGNWRCYDYQVAAGAIKARTRTVLTSGSGTYTVPTGCVSIYVRLIGGGGGGGGSRADGSSGTGTGGGNTTFGSSFLTGGGGGAGRGGTSGFTGGVGGTATGGDVNCVGFCGDASVGNASAGASSLFSVYGVNGASSQFGSGGTGGSNGGGAGNAASSYGAGGGGGGGSGSTVNGSGGGAGGYVEKVIGAPSASYSYAVGGAGGGGTGVTGGSGGNGVGGLIVIDEYYSY